MELTALFAHVQGMTAIAIGVIIGLAVALLFAFSNPLIGVLRTAAGG